MSHSCFGAAFTRHEDMYRQQVMADTWWHLAPEKDKAYKGFILFADSAYDGPVLIDSDFDGLDNSPWLYDAICDFIAERKTKPGCIYRFVGSIKNYRFKGKTSIVPVPSWVPPS